MNAFYNLQSLWTNSNGLGPARTLALALLAAHLLGDFVFQTDRMVASKRDVRVLVLHGTIHALLAYVLVARWNLWLVAPIAGITHFGIDYTKGRLSRNGQMAFFADQAAHVVVLVLLAAEFGPHGGEGYWIAACGAGAAKAMGLVCGAVLCVRVCAIVIGFWVQPCLDEINEARPDDVASTVRRGLTHGGRLIGQWERALIFLFFLMGSPSAVGFLIAAKSIFRFGELMDRRNRMEAEYITIGTLMSFGCAMGIAWLTTRWIGHIR